jgi:hypothetical protein
MPAPTTTTRRFRCGSTGDPGPWRAAAMLLGVGIVGPKGITKTGAYPPPLRCQHPQASTQACESQGQRAYSFQQTREPSPERG